MARAASVLLLLVAVVYGRALGFGFTFDDRSLIELNESLGDLSTLPLALVRDLFFNAEGVRPSPYWRPVVTCSYYLDHWIGGGSPVVFHLNNLVVLWVAALGVWRLLAPRWGRVEALAWAALFTVHPVLVESASNIAARTDLYCVAFGVWGLVIAKRHPWGSLALVLGACGSKEIGVIFPLVYVAWWGREQYRWKAPAVAVFGFLGVRWLLVMQWGLEPLSLGLDAWQTAGGRAMALVSQLLMPLPIAHGGLLATPGPASAIGGWLICLLLGRAAWKWKRSAPGLAVATVLVMGPILIALLASPNQPRLSHGFLVVPLLGLILALQVMCQERKSVAKPIGVGVLILGFMSATRVGVWESDLTLFEASHALESDDAEVRLNLARTVVLGDPKRSVLLLEGVVGFSPRRKREAAAVRAQALLKLGEAEQAVEWLRIAAGSDTESAWATGTLCVLLAGSPDAESEDICRGAVDLLPDDADVANALGIVYARKGELNSAATWFGRALEIAPQRAAFRANLEAAHLASQRQ